MEARGFAQKVTRRLLGSRPVQVFNHEFKQRVLEPFLAKVGARPIKYIPVRSDQLSLEHGYDDEIQIKESVQKVRNNTMATFERLATLWQQVRYLDRYGIEGSLVECGVWKGGTIGMMALGHMASHPQNHREIHLFDSFEGLPEPIEKDGKMAFWYAKKKAHGTLSSIGKCVGTLDENKNLFRTINYPEDKVNFHVGWFQDVLPKVAPSLGPIALLRLDGDWYESTMVCLKHLYPKVVKGGVIVIDDYGHWEGCKKAVDEFIATLKSPVLLGHIDYSGRYWIKLEDA
ncbi:MAG: TylF/MycF/NovP-related O-methyltransferase [Bacteriovoracia bacterium]